MIETRGALIENLRVYKTSFSEEAIFIDQFLELLTNERCYSRDFLPGHITASAWIINPNRTHAFMIRHAKLNKWLQPGGHADGDDNLLRVVLKEVEEETGIINPTLITKSFFDIDIHLIPARKEFPEHYHFDVRFAFEVDDNTSFNANHESTDIGWKNMAELERLIEAGSSITRMIRKTTSL